VGNDSEVNRLLLVGRIYGILFLKMFTIETIMIMTMIMMMMIVSQFVTIS